MSRMGKVALAIPEKVKVEFKDQVMHFQGPLGKLSLNIHRLLDVKIEPKQVSVFQRVESKEANMMQGTTRGLIKNCLEGVNTGYKKELEVSGLGYKMSVEGQKLVLNVGYSLPQIYMKWSARLRHRYALFANLSRTRRPALNTSASTLSARPVKQLQARQAAAPVEKNNE
jgi:ribosomal protein L6P/L9E